MTEVVRDSENLLCFFLKICAFVVVYWTTSIGITFFQNDFVKVFRFPFTIVCVHLAMKFLYAGIVRACLDTFCDKKRTPKSLISSRRCFTFRENIVMIALPAAAGSFDIALSNWGMETLTVSLITMIKSTVIVFILAFALLLRLEKPTASLIIPVFLIASGLSLFTYKSEQFDTFGFVITLAASVCAGVRWAFSQVLMQKSGLSNPFDMMFHMQPWMFLSLLPCAIFIEGPRLLHSEEFLATTEISATASILFRLFVGATIAFVMESVEYLILETSSSLTLSIAGILKEVLTLLLAHETRGDTMNIVNFLGVCASLTGVTLYVVYKAKKMKEERGAKSADTAFLTKLSDAERHNLAFTDDDFKSTPLVRSVSNSPANRDMSAKYQDSDAASDAELM